MEVSADKSFPDFRSPFPVPRSPLPVRRFSNILTKPLKVSLDVYNSVRIGGNNYGSLEENNKLASVTLLRSYMSDGVTRHVVESGGFYGTLFIPSGEGPFPGIVQLSVSTTKK